MTINGQPAPVVNASINQLTLQLPTALNAGPALLRVNNGADSSPAVAVSIDTPPALIQSAVDASNVSVNVANTARAGQVIRLLMSGFADPGTVIFPNQVSIVVGGITHSAIEVVPANNGLFSVSFVLSNLVPSGITTPVTVYLDGRSSLISVLAVSN